jgi:DNA adenine methylase
MTAFAGYGCSYGGKFFGGYARGAPGRSYASNARNSLLKKFAQCSSVIFARRDYRSLSPGRAFLVYCDPPYAETTGYAATGAFDSSEFWETARRWSRAGARVLVSEYTAPEDFTCVWSTETRTDMHGAGRAGRVERLFEYGG